MAELTIKELRAKTGMSQKQFAERFNLSVRTLQDWEQGRKTPKEERVKMISEIINEGSLSAPKGMLTIKELADACDSTAVIVRSHLQNYADKLNDHTCRDYKELLLDKYAQDFIRELVENNREPVVILAIGYEKAKNLMKKKDWKMRVIVSGEEIEKIELYHPHQPPVYTVRRDSGRKLIPECRTIASAGNDSSITILCYDHADSDESLI